MADIRNIIQSHHEREIIKTAPDLVVYLDGLPYVFNPWLPRNQGEPVLVNFNDYITTVSTTHGIETLIPHSGIHLSVPNHERYLFQAPGGNRVLNSMDEIQIYAKGYYFSDTGNSVYHRIFHGMIQSISYVDTGTSLEIDITCLGVLHLMELMQVNLAPSAMSHGDATMTPFQTKFARLNAFQTIDAMFSAALDVSTFLRTSVDEQNINRTGHMPGLTMGFINKWQRKLKNLKQLVRLYGFDQKTSGARLEVEESTDKAKVTTVTKKNDTAGILLKNVQRHLPSMGIGQVTLLDSKITSRLEHVKTMVNCILYEAYQDLDGSIIIKPPLYNLDVTQLSKKSDYTNETNPFVVFASEVESESETEDESQIRATRMTLQGTWSTTIQLAGGNDILGIVSFIDAKLVSRFGVREEPPRTITFLGNNKEGMYALAAAELAKSNKGFRSYSCTIPIRPELKLGFPLYISHHDMFVYPSSISTSYNVGGRATMSIQADTVRKRPMMEVEVDVQGEGGKSEKATVYKSLPNLCLKWSLPQKGMQETDRSNPVNADFSLARMEPTPGDFKRLIDYQKNKLGNSFSVESEDENGKSTGDPSKVKRWRVQNNSPYDLKASEDGQLNRTDFKGSKRFLVDAAYLNLTRTVQPYTDEGGYEVMSPFPWGRWMTLDEAIEEFTDEGFLEGTRSEALTRIVEGGEDFVYAGLGSLNLTSNGQINGKSVLQLLEEVQKDVSNPFTTAFELGPMSPSPESQKPAVDTVNSSKSSDSKAAMAVDQTAEAEGSTKLRPFVGRGQLGLGPNDERVNPLTDAANDRGTRWASAMTEGVDSGMRNFGSSLFE